MIKYDNIRISVIGGDMRMMYCAKELAQRGFECCFSGFDSGGIDCGDAVRCRSVEDAVKGASVVILPTPVSSDGCRLNSPFSKREIRLDDIMSELSAIVLLLGGVCTPGLCKKADEAGITLIDYMKDEELTVKNAVATAEGAVELAIRELPFTLHNANVLVTGYGRVGRACAGAFNALGADVTVCARRGDALAWASFDGCKTADMSALCRCAQNKALIINTVPELIIDKNVLSFTSTDTLIMDLASMPGGVDDEAASAAGVRVIHALSLPGRTSPGTAGKNIAEAVIGIMKRTGVL